MFTGLPNQAKKLYGETAMVKRDIVFNYRSWTLGATIQSLPEEIDVRVAAYIKDRCVGHGLHMMAFEKGWADAPEQHQHPTDEAVLKDFNNARCSEWGPLLNDVVFAKRFTHCFKLVGA